MESLLERMCIEAATESAAAVEKWRRQRRTLERMPSHLAEALLRHLLRRRLLFPSLLEVFKYSVEEIDLRGESCVDAEWMAYLGAFRYLRSIILADCNRINNSALWSITGMANLKEVDLSRCSKITDAGIRHLLSIPALEKLCISQTGVTADGVAGLASLTNLFMLDLGGLPVTDSALSSLQEKVIKLVWRNLYYLELQSLMFLKPSNMLKRVNFVSWIVQLFPSVISFLRSMNALTNLNLSDSAVVDNSVEHIAYIGANLRYLNLSSTKVTSEGIGALAGHVPNLEIVLLSGTPIDDTAVSYISVMPSLKAINLSKTNVKGLIHQESDVSDDVPTFAALQNLSHLERLDLEEIHIKDAALHPLTNLGRLSYLSLRSVSLTDASLYHVSSAPKLVYLGIRDAV
ncbi:UNVERIFIED_CONTAM: hypothetical protein Sradi_4982500 [Sesamum radiatum]|uniref:Uncharacterized protein n=1 Tax=Sesamum radiatum TaxID=300843 RepID=A0AAW2MGL9_SESRA